jgi:sugar lactone lactonase YvrE
MRALVRDPWRGIVRSRVSSLLVAVLAALVILGLAAGAASAAVTYSPAGSFGTAGAGGSEQLTASSATAGMAVDDATGQIFVADSTSTSSTLSADEIKVYAASGGGLPSYVTAFGSGVLATPASIAVDQSSGAIYVGDPGSGRIFKYTSDHAPTPTFTQDLAYIGPSPGASSGNVGDFASPMAVDPRNGNLLVADRSNHVVSRYSASGAFLSSFDGSGSAAGTFHAPTSIAVDATGEVYVVDVTQAPLMSFSGSSVVEPFTPAGVADGSLTPIDRKASAVAYDSFSGNVLVVGNNNNNPPATPLLYIFHSGSIVATTSFPAETNGQFLTTIAVDENSGRLYGLFRQFHVLGNGVEVFDPVVLPTVTIGGATVLWAT